MGWSWVEVRFNIFFGFRLATICPRDVKVVVKMGWSGLEVILNIFSRKRVYSRVLYDLGRSPSARCTHNENRAGVGKSGMRRIFFSSNVPQLKSHHLGKIWPRDVKVVVKMGWSWVEVRFNIFLDFRGQNLAPRCQSSGQNGVVRT